MLIRELQPTKKTIYGISGERTSKLQAQTPMESQPQLPAEDPLQKLPIHALSIMVVAVILLLLQYSITNNLKQRECGGHEAAGTVSLQQPKGEDQRQQPRQLRSSGFVLYASGRYPLPAGLDVAALASIQLCCSTHMGLLDCRRGSVSAIQDVETGDQYFVVRLERGVSSCILSYAVVLQEDFSPPHSV